MKEEDVAALRAENLELRAQVAQLAAAQEKFRVLYEYSSDAHLIFDQRGILDCNQATIKMLGGRDKSQILLLHPAQLSPEYQPDGQRSLDKSVEMDRRARESGFHRFEWMHRRLTGEDFPVEVTLTPVMLAEGLALLVVWHDLTAIKAREAALRETIATIAEQRAKIRSLSMPVIEVLHGVIMAPVFGELDTTTASEMTVRVLSALAEWRAWAVLIDLTALGAVDGSTAGFLLRMLNAIRLLGAEGILVGISPRVAQAMTQADSELSGVQALPTMREAIELCQRRRR
jgi:anti-anti-sigma factor